MANIPEAKMNYTNQETGKYSKDCNIEVIFVKFKINLHSKFITFKKKIFHS